MLFAILRKEFVKLRAYWLLALGLHLALLAYVYLAMEKLFRMDHAEVVWYRVLHLGQLFYDPLTYPGLATGVLLAGAQFFPEMRGQRFRIALHLPVPPHLVVLAHLLVGLSAVALLLGLDLAALSASVALRFPREVVWAALVTALPWSLAGIVGYVGTALTLLEPSWKLRVINLGVSVGLAAVFLQHAPPGGFARLLPLLALTVLVFTPSVLLPAYRFRYRRG